MNIYRIRKYSKHFLLLTVFFSNLKYSVFNYYVCDNSFCKISCHNQSTFIPIYLLNVQKDAKNEKIFKRGLEVGTLYSATSVPTFLNIGGFNVDCPWALIINNSWYTTRSIPKAVVSSGTSCCVITCLRLHIITNQPPI